jgi:predicted ferric reductase
MNPVLSATLWIGAYLVGPAPAGGGFWWDFAMALGFAALAMMGVQFLLTARFKHATAPFGIDIIYYFHRYLAIVALAILFAHYLILRIDYPAVLGTADPLKAAPYMTAGRVAMGLFVLVVVLSLARRTLKLNYEWWRLTHALFATVAVALALWHVIGSGRYLAMGWKQALWLGYGIFWLGLIVHVRLLRPWHITRTPWRVAAVRPEHGRVWTLVLEPTTPGQLRFQPGQFAWLTLRASPFALREHPFSIASSAERPERIELSIKELGDFTLTIKDVQPGEIAFLDAPYGAFSTDRHSSAHGFAFIAGGIGAAPIMSMLRTLADRGDRRPLVFLYGNRVQERIAFQEELDQLSQRLNLKVVHVLRDPPSQGGFESGFITREVLERHLPAERREFEYFICGPTPMTRSVERSLAALGVLSSHVHSEIFDWV